MDYEEADRAILAKLQGAYGIEQVPRDTPDAMTCGECGRSWLEDITPAGRCPWEYYHEYDEEDD